MLETFSIFGMTLDLIPGFDSMCIEFECAVIIGLVGSENALAASTKKWTTDSLLNHCKNGRKQHKLYH